MQPYYTLTAAVTGARMKSHAHAWYISVLGAGLRLGQLVPVHPVRRGQTPLFSNLKFPLHVANKINVRLEKASLKRSFMHLTLPLVLRLNVG